MSAPKTTSDFSTWVIYPEEHTAQEMIDYIEPLSYGDNEIRSIICLVSDMSVTVNGIGVQFRQFENGDHFWIVHYLKPQN